MGGWHDRYEQLASGIFEEKIIQVCGEGGFDVFQGEYVYLSLQVHLIKIGWQLGMVFFFFYLKKKFILFTAFAYLSVYLKKNP